MASDGGHLAVIAVAGGDGRVHASVVSAGVLEDPVTGVASVGVVVVGGARKLELMRQVGRASATFKDGYRWVSVEGPVHLIGPDDPPDNEETDVPGTIRDIFKAAGGAHEDWATFDAVMATERRCAVFIDPETILGNPGV